MYTGRMLFLPPNQQSQSTRTHAHTDIHTHRHTQTDRQTDRQTHTQTHTAVQRPLSGATRVSWYHKKVKPIWILLKQETLSGSGTRWAICNSAPRSRQITMPAPHHSVFYRPNALPAAQPTVSKHWRESTVSKHWRQNARNKNHSSRVTGSRQKCLHHTHTLTDGQVENTMLPAPRISANKCEIWKDPNVGNSHITISQQQCNLPEYDQAEQAQKCCIHGHFCNATWLKTSRLLFAKITAATSYN